MEEGKEEEEEAEPGSSGEGKMPGDFELGSGEFVVTERADELRRREGPKFGIEDDERFSVWPAPLIIGM
eukprot:CAMPEP_0119497690 /NCGR_PEP_ID=MMETSP1344-20130328/20666_1 /TAXON_ID=236787 /ORGANISM="Florenciella parvula, Strain CCMP2471" /LENGTH=68 /DNA_ID=CAMNT_0007533495 /DNA_START=60 /DNA_END=266 /DNA_ORIENTATION=-